MELNVWDDPGRTTVLSSMAVYISRLQPVVFRFLAPYMNRRPGELLQAKRLEICYCARPQG